MNTLSEDLQLLLTKWTGEMSQRITNKLAMSQGWDAHDHPPTRTLDIFLQTKSHHH